MNLRENIDKNMNKKELNLDTFGEIMDVFIRKSACSMTVFKAENSEEWHVEGAGCGAVVDFYIFLNTIEPIFLKMLEEMKHQIDAEKLAEALTDILKETLIAAAKEDTHEQQAD